MVTVLADAHLPYLDSFLGETCNIIRFETAEQVTQKASQADALLVRTTLKLRESAHWLKSTPIKFIGSATAGTDHLDIPYLNSLGMVVNNAPGCNARAVAEYVVTCMLEFVDFDIASLKKLTVGIAGYGHTGSSVAEILQKLGVSFRAYDPPLEQTNANFKSCSFSDFLSCDILTLHVPFTTDSEFLTQHMLGSHSQPDAKLIINASRGGVIDEDWLVDFFIDRKSGIAMTDVWVNEPNINLQLLKKSRISTPHIAGYSRQAKRNASFMICKELCNFFGIDLMDDAKLQIPKLLPLEANSLKEAVRNSHILYELNTKLRQNPQSFSSLRNDHTLRNEFGMFELANISNEDKNTAVSLGFNLSD